MKKFIAVACLVTLFLMPVSYVSVSAVDKTAPIYKSAIPANNQGIVERNCKISVTFSENIYKSTTFTKIQLKNITTGKNASISRIITGKILKITHTYFLAYNNTYTLTIPAKSVKDKAGNLLKKTVTIKFRTRGQSSDINYDLSRAQCMANLRIINGAYQLAVWNNETITDINNLAPNYFESVPVCPAGGKYSLVAETIDSMAHSVCSDLNHQKEMFWPLPGHYQISSPFGLRYHPITGEYKIHTGEDIPAPSGCSIVAAKSGTVVVAGWNNAYGNETVIDHGNGIETFYGHQSSILVKVGQKVKAGEIIGKVGTTGYSTGPHLHFGVIADGIDVDPMLYS